MKIDLLLTCPHTEPMLKRSLVPKRKEKKHPCLEQKGKINPSDFLLEIMVPLVSFDSPVKIPTDMIPMFLDKSVKA